MFLPDQWPAYYKKADGIEITDLDGNKFLDFSVMSVGATTLGYNDPDVNRAVKKVIGNGSTSTLNASEDVELAELLIKLHPWADMARFARSGGEAVSIAVRIARAATKKDKVAFCGYHGWHDWYLASNLADDKNLDGHLLPGLNPLGVPRNLIKSALPFSYNNFNELKSIVAANDIGTIIMEPMRHTSPHKGFLEEVRKIANKIHAVLVFDEISIGWRLTVGGSHLVFGVTPDIAIFSKAMSNGFPMAAVIGKKEIMSVAQDTFISSTSWTERTGPAAALATIKKMKAKNVPKHLEKIGKLIEAGWVKLAKKHKLNLSFIGPYPLITFSFNYPGALELKTLFTQEMLKRGFLAGLTVYVSFAHKESHVKKYISACDEVFGIIQRAIITNTIKRLLEGPVAHSGFKRLT